MTTNTTLLLRWIRSLGHGCWATSNDQIVIERHYTHEGEGTRLYVEEKVIDATMAAAREALGY